MAATVTNTEALGNKISELQTLHDTWADKTYTAVDIGECGGCLLYTSDAADE